MRPLYSLIILLMLSSILTPSTEFQEETTAAVAREPADSSSRVIDPRKALLLGLIPGGGQIYNRAWLKAILVMAAEGYYFTLFQQNLNYYNNYDNYDPPLELPQDDYLELRNKYAWRFLFAYLIGLMDGYVDAHLSTFPPDSADNILPLEKHPREESP